MGLRFLGWGGAVPSRVVTNDDLAKRLGVSAEWIFSRTGIHERRAVGPGETTATLAVEAGRNALQASGLRPDEIALLVVATATPEQLCPATSAFVQRDLGLGCAAFDLNAECSGFVYALVVTLGFLGLDIGPVIVVGVDTHTNAVDPDDRDTSVLLGDGAGAAVVSRTATDNVLAWDLGCNGRGVDFLRIRAGGARMPATVETVAGGLHHLEMDGRLVYTWGTACCTGSVRQVLETAKADPADIDHFVPHQSNARMIDSILRSTGIPGDRLVTNLDRVGNTSSGAIPLALAEAVGAGRVDDDDLVLMSGFGAGMTWGSVLVRWES
jgi:3-oxoacyl-[acyl-carrier-protein] synthase III